MVWSSVWASAGRHQQVRLAKVLHLHSQKGNMCPREGKGRFSRVADPIVSGFSLTINILYVQEVLDHFNSKLLHKMGHYFLDTKYITPRGRIRIWYLWLLTNSQYKRTAEIGMNSVWAACLEREVWQRGEGAWRPPAGGGAVPPHLQHQPVQHNQRQQPAQMQPS